MLTSREKSEARKLLQKCTDEEIFQLCDTVTNKLIDTSTKREAVDAILCYSDSAVQLLKRKKLRRDYLFQYLADNNVIASANAEKHNLKQVILEFWGSEVKKTTEDDTKSQIPQTEDDKLAEQFTKWFYQMLNSYKAPIGVAPTDALGPQHFYEDCILKLQTMIKDVHCEEFKGADIVSQRFRYFTQQEQLIFQPNESRGMSESHGLKVVKVTGTVHQQHQFMGIYEQSFGLVKNPITSNFVIKYSNLKIKKTQEPNEGGNTLAMAASYATAIQQ